MFHPDSPIEHPHLYRRFFRLFNERDYYEAHEVLEDLWIMEVGELRNYYKGLIMWAVALLHWSRGNTGGALRLYRDGGRYLEMYPDYLEGFHLGEFRRDMGLLFRPLTEAGGGDVPAPPPDDHPVLVLDEID